MKLEKKHIILLSVLGVLLVAGAVMFLRSGSGSDEASREFVQQMVKEAEQAPPADAPAPAPTPPGGRMKKNE